MALTPPITALTQQDLLDLLDRVLPSSYLDAIKNIGPGFELLQAYAALFERLSLAASRLAVDSFIDIANTGVKATGTVELFRASAATINTPLDPPNSGSAASIIAGAGAGEMRVSGLANMSAVSVGRFLDIRGTGDVNNTGTFEISAFVVVNTVDVINASAVVPDPNNGTILWDELSRTVTVLAGTVVTTSRGGLDFVTQEDVVFAPAALGPLTVDVEAVAVGYEWNVIGQRTAADGSTLPGEIDTIKILVEDPPLGDTTIQVRQINDTTGGVDDALPALGRNRGIVQGFDEDIGSFRSRVRSLPDTISPDAFVRTVESLLRPFKAEFEIIETFGITYQTAYDGPPTVIPGSLYNPNLFVYDDPDLDGIPFRNRWLDENDRRGGVIVVVENIQPLCDTSMVYDDTVTDIATDLISSKTGGARAVSAYDVPLSVVADFGAIRGAYDGEDLQKNSLYRGLFDTLQDIKPGGVSVAVELRGE